MITSATREPLRFSQLKHMGDCPARFRYELTATEPTKKKPSFEKGTALHSYLIGDPEAVAFYPERRAGKQWEAFSGAHAGKAILIPSESESVIGMRDAVFRNPRAQELLEGTREKTLYWENGTRKCRGTPDVRTGRRIVELKSGRAVRPAKFERYGRWFGYHAALAWYIDGCNSAGVGPIEEAYIVAVGSSPPYPVTTFRLTERAIEQGRKQYRLWFEQLMVCESCNEWPEYAQGDVPFDVPDDDQFSLLISGEEVAT